MTAGSRVLLSKTSTLAATRFAISSGISDTKPQKPPVRAKNGANGCSRITSPQSPRSIASMDRVIPQPGHGSPVSSAKGHGQRLHPTREPAKSTSTVSSVHRQSARCRISGAIQGLSSRFTIIRFP